MAWLFEDLRSEPTTLLREGESRRDPAVRASPRRRRGLCLACRRAGSAFLVFRAGDLDDRAVMFAGGLARDPEHRLVVVDLPADSSLSVDKAEVDVAIRSGVPGPHLAVARCAAKGLTRLPSQRGAVAFRSTVYEPQLRSHTPGDVIVDGGFVAARIRGPQDDPGNTEFLIWWTDWAGFRTRHHHGQGVVTKPAEKAAGGQVGAPRQGDKTWHVTC